MSTEPLLDALAIGGGQAGLAAGYHLRRAGLAFAILESGDRPTGSWPRYYDSLRLFSPRRYSALPGMPFPGDPDGYPTRDEAAAYLEAYAARFRLPVVTGARVIGAGHTAGAGRFRVRTAAGGEYRSRTLIAATGAFGRPHRPALPGEAAYTGRVLHAADYRSPEPFRGWRVVVVGAGNSAVQIGVELAGVARTTLATRRPVRLLAQRFLGRDVHFWLRWTGLDRLPTGRGPGGPGPGAALDTGRYRAALAAGRPDVRPLFARYTATGVVWADGREEAVDAVVLATGYRPDLPYLAGLGALDADGWPVHRAGVSRTVPGLFYVGLEGQRSLASSTLRGVGPDAARVVRAVRRAAGPGRRPAPSRPSRSPGRATPTLTSLDI